MKKDAFLRLSGWSLIVGALLFLLGIRVMMGYDTQYAINWGSNWSWGIQVLGWAIFLSPILFAIGMMGLRARYKIGGGFLLFGAVVGGIVTLIGTLGLVFAPVYSVSETYLRVWFSGAFILFFCLSFFGMSALVEKPLPRWNALPLISGLWFTLLPIGFFWIGKVSVKGFPVVAIAGFVVMAVAQIMLGFILQADAHKKWRQSE